MSDAALTEALKANTEAIKELTAVWNKLAAKALQLEKNPDLPGIQAAGVPLAKFSPPPFTSEGFSL